MPKITVNGASFYYELHGQGQPLILIGGYTVDHLVWAPVLDQLSKEFQVLIFDNRAVGQTVDDGQPLSAELMANDVIALADVLNLKKPDIVGQSMGGTIAQVIANKYPHNIRKLCLLVTTAKWRRAVILAFQSMIAMREKNLDFDTLFDATIAWVFGEAFLSNPKLVSTLKKLMLENPYPQSLENQKRQMRVLETFNGIASLKHIIAETLVVHALEDELAFPYEAQFLVDNIKNAKLATVDAAHGVIMEEPDKLAKILVEFFKV